MSYADGRKSLIVYGESTTEEGSDRGCQGSILVVMPCPGSEGDRDGADYVAGAEAAGEFGERVSGVVVLAAGFALGDGVVREVHAYGVEPAVFCGSRADGDVADGVAEEEDFQDSCAGAVFVFGFRARFLSCGQVEEERAAAPLGSWWAVAAGRGSMRRRSLMTSSFVGRAPG
ncbi:hypothetical protein ACWGHU_10240 [Streptomyces xanthophaeus]